MIAIKKIIRSAFVVLGCLGFSFSSFATTYVIDNLADADNLAAYTFNDGTNTLRKCIRLANADVASPHVINFNATLSGTITLASNLTGITRPTTIDGTTAAGAVAGTPTIVIDGGGIYTLITLAATAHFFTINSICLIRGSGNGGIYNNSGADNGVVKGCYIGIALNGSDQGCNVHGIKLNGIADGWTIGGTTTAERNIISGNAGNGIDIGASDGAYNTNIIGNYIGTNITGITAVPNDIGIYVDAGTSGVLIGGLTSASRNIISGNLSQGMDVRGNNTVVRDNYVGVTSGGNTALGNGDNGIFFNANSSANNSIYNNVVSGNGTGTDDSGIYFVGGTGSGMIIQGNIVGLGADGVTAVPNFHDGIHLDNTDNVTIGGTNASEANIIGKNGRNGIYITISTDIFVLGNYIGTDPLWRDLGNVGNGIYFFDGSTTEFTTIGGTAAGSANYIAYNDKSGIENFKACNVTIQGNYIGVNPAGANMGNGLHGIYLSNTSSARTAGKIGSATTIPVAGEANVIAYNGGDGVSFLDNQQSLLPIRGNSIYCNGQIGIDLDNDGDLSMGNAGVPAPVVLSSTANDINGTCVSGYIVHVYRNEKVRSDCDCEGEIYIGPATVVGTNWSLSHGLGLSAAQAAAVTVTQTSGAAIHNTSPFSICALTAAQCATLSICNPPVLPIELLSFTAKNIEDKYVLLEWITASEKNNDYFEVQKSIDGINWVIIAVVQGGGNQSSQSKYYAKDQSPSAGENYYRLKQVDYDHKSATTKVVSAYINKIDFYVFVTPNPASDIININIKISDGSNLDEEIKIELFDVLGKSVMQTTTKDKISLLPVSSLSSGVYFIVVSNRISRHAEKIMIE